MITCTVHVVSKFCITFSNNEKQNPNQSLVWVLFLIVVCHRAEYLNKVLTKTMVKTLMVDTRAASNSEVFTIMEIKGSRLTCPPKR